MTKNTLATGLIWLAAILVSGVFFRLLSDILIHGLPHLSWSFFAEAPRNAGRSDRALWVHIYDLSMNVAGGDASAYSSARVLILLLSSTALSWAWLNIGYTGELLPYEFDYKPKK